MRLECLDTVKGDLLTVTYTMVVAITGDIRNLCRASHLEFLALFGGHSRLEYSVEDDVAGEAPQRHGARRPALRAQHLRRRILLLGVQVLERKFLIRPCCCTVNTSLEKVLQLGMKYLRKYTQDYRDIVKFSYCQTIYIS